MAKRKFNVLVGLNASSASYKALEHAVNLCQHMDGEYKLTIIYVVALNPAQSLPYLDRLEKSFNMEIQHTAEQELQACKDHLTKKYGDKIVYEFAEVEGEGEIGPIIEEYIDTHMSNLDLLVVGTRNLGGLKR